MQSRTVSVVMVSYNTGPILWRSIESVLMQEGLHELILVDNGNSLQVQKQLSEMALSESRLKLLSGHGNIGFAKGCNVGAKEATGRYLLLLNPDCILPAGTFSTVIDAMENMPEAWMAGCCIINPDGTEQSGSRRNILTPWIALVEGLHLYQFAPEKHLFARMNFHDVSPQKKPEYIPAISGAFMLLERRRYHQLGGMDEQYFFHVEDLDFCFQVLKQGGKIVYVPDVKIVHYRSSSRVSDIFIEQNKAKGFAQYFRKNFKHKYFPGFISIVVLSIYMRFLMRAAMIKLRSLKGQEGLDHKRRKTHEDQRIREFLSTYSYIENHDRKTTKEDIAGRAPILLAGASGQIGLCILRRLLAASVDITAIYYTRAIDFSHPNLTWRQTDFSRQTQDLCDIKAKTLIYTSPLWLLPKLLQSLPEGTIDRLVCFSSTSVFAKANSGSMYEKELVGKFLWAEKEVARLCEERGIKWTILRPTLVYGIGLDRNVSRIVKFIKRFGFFPIAGKGNGLRQPVHADDLAIAVLKVLNCEAAAGKAFNLCGGEQISYRDMVGRIFDVLGMKRSIITLQSLPIWLDIYSRLVNKPDINGEIARRMNNHLVFDDSDARKTFGYEPRMFLSAGKQDLAHDFRLFNLDNQPLEAIRETNNRRATI